MLNSVAKKCCACIFATVVAQQLLDFTAACKLCTRLKALECCKDVSHQFVSEGLPPQLS